MLTKKQAEIILDIISDPCHGMEFYTDEMIKELLEKVDEILSGFKVDEHTTDQEKIDFVNDYIKKNVKIRREYFDAFVERIPEIPKSELIYRTAYSALCKGETMCAGYAEASRMLLECLGLKTKTLLSKLPGKDKQLLHYVVAIEYDKGSGRNHYVLDPERETSCEAKGYDFRRYLMGMTYILPDKYFYEQKVGKSGVGLKANDYLGKFRPKHVLSKDNVDRLFEEGKEFKNE